MALVTDRQSMSRCLVDINVLLALIVPRHEHHPVALAWFDGLAAGEAGLCRFVQLALVRLMANRSVMGKYAVPTDEGWGLVERLLQDERIEFASEPSTVDSVLPALLHQRVPNGKLVGDAYLAAFAIASGRQMVTLDGGFRSFRGLDVDLIR
jgi:toxin-antitoxin system PIN domain toxin